MTTREQLIEVIEKAFMEDAGEYLEDTYDAIAAAILERWCLRDHYFEPFYGTGKFPTKRPTGYSSTCSNCGQPKPEVK